MSWVPLHVHSQYSILNSTAQVGALVSRAAELGCPAIALTDQGNMFGSVEFYKACQKSQVKPIVGCELFVAPQSRHDKKRIPGFSAGYPLVFLVKNTIGYRNLCKLSSIAHLEGFYYTPRIDKSLIEEFSEGLICLSGPINGRVGSWILEGKTKELEEEVEWLQKVFKEDFYLEIQRHRMSDADIAADRMSVEPWLYQKYQDYVKSQEIVIEESKKISQKYGIPCVATNDIHYLHRNDWKAHEILINVQSGEPCEIWERDSAGNQKAKVVNPKREVFYSHEYYFKSPSQMEALFSDIPEAVERSCKIAEDCSFDFDFKTKYYPVYVPPALEGKEYTPEEREVAASQFLRDLCTQQIPHRYSQELLEIIQLRNPDKDPLTVIRERLDYELDIIIPKGMGDYLLIVYDFIAWAKNKGIPMGPGRGSGAGSIILYLIGITDIEPLRFNLFFERFINPERLSYPDIDVDICMERRQEVIDYTVQKYGKEKVAQIITFGTMKAKMAVKDVGRVLSIPLAKVNAIAKLIPEDPTMTLTKALEIDPEFKAQCDSDPEVQNLIQIALSLEGSVRNTGIHAAGLIIGGRPLVETIPLCLSKDSDMAVTQFSMKPVEAVGLLKIDFLGLKTLTSIQKAVDIIKESYDKVIDWVNIPLNDMTTFDLLNQGKTQGIFQLESGGMQELAKKLRIDKFEEIIAVGALYRPGPMEMIPSFINRKHGRESIEIDHPLMADILSETYGIMVYQEQVMQIASCLAKFTLGEGDVLRRAMGKKDREEMARQREKFKAGALENQIDEETSMKIFDKIEKFASYGFNKSHAAAYGYLTYVTAFLKANYPEAWMAALMTSDRDDIAKVAKVIRECQSNGISVLPPDVNTSGKEFLATTNGIRFAMTGIKGVGEGVVLAIVEERKANGPFKSLYDFIQRIDPKKVGKKVVEYLVEAGCFDFTNWSREALVESIDDMFSAAAKEQREEAQGILDLFSLIDEEKGEQFETPPQIHKPLTKQQVLKREYELLGFYLREHPLDEFRHLYGKLSCCPLSEVTNLGKLSVFRTAFIIEDVSFKIAAKSQKKFAILKIRDGQESYELPVWADLCETYLPLLVETQLIYAVLQVEQDESMVKLQTKWLGDLTKIDEEMVFACDAAYDRAKSSLKMLELRNKSQTAAKAKKMDSKEPSKEGVEKVNKTEKKVPPVCHITFDMDRGKLSHVMQLKNIFRSHAGDSPIVLKFHSQNRQIGSLEISAEWGVEWGEEVKGLISKIHSVESVVKQN
jgi:DNA polymerase III subunit alpha